MPDRLCLFQKNIAFEKALKMHFLRELNTVSREDFKEFL